VKFPHLERWTADRRTHADYYSERFAAVGLDRVLGLPHSAARGRHVWNQYVVRVPDGRRDALRQFLAEAKIGSEIYYPLGLHQQQCFSYLGYQSGDLPETERAAAEVLALPIFPELTEEEQQAVVDRIGAFFQASRDGAHGVAAPKFLTHPAARRQPAP
jgi:dTDP-4-amino-4,6-dideoxygalactose transaminase